MVRRPSLLARTVFLESVGRFGRLFNITPPSKVAQFTERVPMVKGRLDKKASTATGYAWFVWENGNIGPTQLLWIPPCRRDLERDDDYELPRSHIREIQGVKVVRRQQSEMFT